MPEEVVYALKSDAEIEDLKTQWKADPCFDIEDTPGFEAHRTDLLIWRLQYELEWERRNHRSLKNALDVLISAVRPRG